MSEIAAAAPVAPSTPAPTSAPAPAESSAPVAGAAPTTPTDKPAAPPAPKTYKRKINGQDVEIPSEHVDALARTLGLKPDEFLSGVSLHRAAYQKFEEAAKLRREMDEARKAQEGKPKDPRIAQLVQQHGMAEDDAAAFLRVQDLYQREQQTPEQRQLADERKRREELEAKVKADEDGRKKSQAEAAQKVEIDRLNREIPEAVKKVGLPATPRVGRIMVEKMLAMARAGVQPNPVEAAHAALGDLRAETKGLLGDMDGAGIETFLGQDAVRKLTEHLTARLRGAPAPTLAAVPKTVEAPKQTMLSVDEWRAKYA
jgi:hypothetical protein